MVTERKKRKQRLLLRLYIGLFLFIFLGIGVYAGMAIVTQKPYVSPLPLALATLRTFTSPSTKTLENTLTSKKIHFVSVVKDSESSYRVQLASDSEVIFSSKKDINEQVASLQLILARLTIEGKGLRRLDLRFDKPVIVFR